MEKLLAKIFGSVGVTLHLTGSRYFNTSHSQSDWDFYTEELNDEQKKLLIELGFVRIDKTFYTDCLTKAVWFSVELNTHIQEVSNIEVKTMAQELLKKHDLYLNITKRNMKNIWNLVEDSINYSH